MKNGYIIYQGQEGVKNQSFVDLFQQHGRKVGLAFERIDLSELEGLPMPDFVLNRTRKPEVSVYYESRKIPVFHESDIVVLGNDKYACIRYLKEKFSQKFEETKLLSHTIQIPTAHPMRNMQSFSQIRDCFMAEALLREEPQRLVLKTSDGHGGREVHCLDPSSSQQEINHLFQNYTDRTLLCQEWIDCHSMDLRVYILQGEIYQAVLRQGIDDFRSNYSLGGSIQSYPLTSTQKEYIMKFVEAFGADRLWMVGIDFLLLEDGNLVFNELEEMVGSRMLYRCTDSDIVKDAVFLLKKLL